MIKYITSLMFAVVALSVSANPAAVHTYGDAHSRALAKIFFSETPVIASPGADGLLVWKKLDNNKTDVAIQLTLAVHFLPALNTREDFASKHDLLAALSFSAQALAVRPNFPAESIKDLKNLGRPITVGFNGHACKALITEAFAKAGVEFIYVAYRTPQEAIAAMLGGHIDATCPASASLQQMVRGKTGKIIFDITGHHGFTLTTYLFVGKEMPEATRKSILQQITRPLTPEDIAVAEANGITLNVRTGKDALETFTKDRKIWQKITQLD